MTQQEVKLALRAVGLQIPEAELLDILNATKFVYQMRTLIRRTRSPYQEPASITSFTKDLERFKNDLVSSKEAIVTSKS